MIGPLALALLAAAATEAAGAGADSAGTRLARPTAKCPADDFRPDEGGICLARRGRNWTYAFAYPGAAARIPALDARLRSESADEQGGDDDDLRSLIAHANKHRRLQLSRETIFKVDSDLPALLALTRHHSEYSGGAHGWFGYSTLLWDKAGDRALEFADLFSDPSEANAEIRDQLCPALNALRRSRNPDFAGQCQEPPYDSVTLLSTGGRATTLKVTFVELEGYAGGTYTVHVPVTRRLLGLVAERFRAQFALSAAPPRACNNEEDCVEKSAAGPQPR